MIDLHGVRLYEVDEVIIDFLEKHEDNCQDLTIITGKGLHSSNGLPVIKPAVEKVLHQKGYSFHEANGNSGRLIIPNKNRFINKRQFKKPRRPAADARRRQHSMGLPSQRTNENRRPLIYCVEADNELGIARSSRRPCNSSGRSASPPRAISQRPVKNLLSELQLLREMHVASVQPCRREQPLQHHEVHNNHHAPGLHHHHFQEISYRSSYQSSITQHRQSISENRSSITQQASTSIKVPPHRNGISYRDSHWDHQIEAPRPANFEDQSWIYRYNRSNTNTVVQHRGSRSRKWRTVVLIVAVIIVVFVLMIYLAYISITK